MQILSKDLLNNLVTIQKPGVWSVVNSEQKTARVFHSSNVAESIVRNIHLTFLGDVFVYSSRPTLLENKLKAYEVSLSLKERGYIVLNRVPKYYLRGKIQPTVLPNGFLYMVYLGTRNYDIKLVAVFSKVGDGEVWIKDRKPHLGQPGALEVGLNEEQRELLKQGKQYDFIKEELKKLGIG